MRTCCDYHRHLDADLPFAPGEPVSCCGGFFPAEEARAWDRLGLSAGQIQMLPPPPQWSCGACGQIYCECEKDPELRWTRARPKISGWYWVQEPHFRTIVEVKLGTSKGDKAYFVGCDSGERLEDLEFNRAWWLGPLPIPEPPKENP